MGMAGQWSGNGGATQAVLHPGVLLIDADEERGQRVAAALTLADFRVYVANSPYAASERVIRELMTLEAVLLGQGDWQSRTTDVVMTRMLQRLQERRGRRLPVALLPFASPMAAPATAPHLGGQDQRLPAQLREEQVALEVAWATLPGMMRDGTPSLHTLALEQLPAYGLEPRVSQQLRSKNAHFRQVLQAAREVIGSDRWETLISDVGLARYRRVGDWPPNDEAREVPAVALSLLNQAVELSAPQSPDEQLRRWSEIGTKLSLEQHTQSWLTQQLVRRLPHERSLSLALNGFVNEMNDIRGEDLHAWAANGETGAYWLVHYSNLYAYGRIRRFTSACAVWVASIEATLRYAQLEDAFAVREVECACQTQTGHCVFLLEPRN